MTNASQISVLSCNEQRAFSLYIHKLHQLHAMFTSNRSRAGSFLLSRVLLALDAWDRPAVGGARTHTRTHTQWILSRFQPDCET